MINRAQAKKYNSAFLDELLAEITPLEMAQTRAKMELAERIEELMKAKGWNKKQLAETTGKHPSEITKWCSGTHNFTFDVLIEIAFVFELRIVDMFTQIITDKSKNVILTGNNS